MITCIIVDDERKARESFQKIIFRYFKDNLKVVALCESVQEGVAAINKYSPNVVFLDIEMPNENGFKLFDYFDYINFKVVFTTAFNKYAINAIKYSALDYLLKPINFIDLNEAITRFEKQKIITSREEQVKVLLSNMNMGNSIKSKVALPTLSGYQMEKINNIMYCEAEQNYTKIHLVYGKYILVSKTLKFIEELMPSEVFFRIHKTFLLNLNYVKKYLRTDGHVVILDDGTELSVAKRRIDDFSSALTKKSFNQSQTS